MGVDARNAGGASRARSGDARVGGSGCALPHRDDHRSDAGALGDAGRRRGGTDRCAAHHRDAHARTQPDRDDGVDGYDCGDGHCDSHDGPNRDCHAHGDASTDGDTPAHGDVHAIAHEYAEPHGDGDGHRDRDPLIDADAHHREPRDGAGSARGRRRITRR